MQEALSVPPSLTPIPFNDYRILPIKSLDHSSLDWQRRCISPACMSTPHTTKHVLPLKSLRLLGLRQVLNSNTRSFWLGDRSLRRRRRPPLKHLPRSRGKRKRGSGFANNRYKKLN